MIPLSSCLPWGINSYYEEARQGSTFPGNMMHERYRRSTGAIDYNEDMNHDPTRCQKNKPYSRKYEYRLGYIYTYVLVYIKMLNACHRNHFQSATLLG